MGLDQYSYVTSKSGQHDEFWDGAEFNKDSGEFENPAMSKPRELAYWRKHPNLHGWMERLWLRKGAKQDDSTHDFNGVELELTWEDLDQLERDINNSLLPDTSGFFFGNNADDHYREKDLEFIKNARAELFVGLKVFYNSSW